ncbi:hypothetical protein [Candidatus Symbiopectobacterium endolongispinus]|uniref:hypothetical protein n=1 Tax=Candidatus Symbiopectobacterium endolongispinus TaxID=2812664 RepID=UPI003F682389
MLDNTEACAVIQKREAGGNTTLGQIGYGVVQQITRHGNHNNDDEKLIQPGAHLWI